MKAQYIGKTNETYTNMGIYEVDPKKVKTRDWIPLYNYEVEGYRGDEYFVEKVAAASIYDAIKLYEDCGRISLKMCRAS